MRIGLDIDGVLACFQQAVIKKAREMGVPFYKHWTQWDQWQPIHGGFGEIWAEIEREPAFWFGIEPFQCAHIDFPVQCYVTARPIESSVTALWLEQHGFPSSPVHTVGMKTSKVPTLKREGIELFVDDKPETVEEVNEAGILCLCLDRPYNEFADHLPRIKYLNQVNEVIALQAEVAQ